ncbi:SH3 domain-containing protein [Malonomonas rubra DSM 5091]|uniref:SH3 domain-containing protein n=1 Tax=Malonomonas rubra DSM 5091 TaxID=1122189 RepID=A0A1M6F8C5_MALRU|nr:SH3 domain-containing protein [Malonomonas rubra]SHI93957.1 SH3 domain-containing protein [Malonomonas rubra DSM 5091]
MKKIIIVSLLLFTATTSLAKMVSVIHLPAELRDKPMVSGSKMIQKLERYAPLEVIESGSDYYKVKTRSGKVGYLHRSLTGDIKSVVVTGDICNVRTGPGTEFPIVFKAYKGNSFKVLSQEQDWVEIQGPDNKTGWIWQNLVWGE